MFWSFVKLYLHGLPTIGPNEGVLREHIYEYSTHVLLIKENMSWYTSYTPRIFTFLYRYDNRRAYYDMTCTSYEEIVWDSLSLITRTCLFFILRQIPSFRRKSVPGIGPWPTSCSTLFHYSSFQSIGSPWWKDISVFEVNKKRKKDCGPSVVTENNDEQGGLIRCAAHISQSIRLWNVCLSSVESKLDRVTEVLTSTMKRKGLVWLSTIKYDDYCLCFFFIKSWKEGCRNSITVFQTEKKLYIYCVFYYSRIKQKVTTVVQCTSYVSLLHLIRLEHVYWIAYYS